MSAYNLDKNRFNEGFARGYNLCEGASWAQVSKEVVLAEGLLVELNTDVSALATRFEEYGRAVAVICVAMKNYPSNLLESDVLYEGCRQAFSTLYPLARDEVESVLRTQIAVFRKRNGHSNSRVLSRLVKLHQLIY